MSTKTRTRSQRKAHRITDIAVHAFLGVLAFIWVIPIVWILAASLNANPAPYSSTFFPTEYSFNNYVQLFSNRNVLDFPRMFINTLIVAIFTCLISVTFVLIVSYSLSRLRFKFRRVYMNIALILGMFPGIMAVVAIYFILKSVGLTQGWTTNIALIIVYSAGAGMTFYVMKGFMDTIPISLDEAALLDGCSRWQIFTKIILPISKPMIVYQSIVSFLTPWLDFVLAKAIARTQEHYTVSLGLWKMLEKEYIFDWFARFAAGAVCVSIPITILFIVMQRFYQESMAGSVKG